MNARRRRARSALVAALVAALAVAACGMPADDVPRVIPPADIPDELLQPSSTTTPEAVGPFRVDLWWINDGLLAERPSNVSDLQPATAITTLLTVGPPSDVQTSIPPGTELIGTDENEDRGVLTINLSEQILGIQSPELDRALAQIVFTATEDEGISGVRFQVNGEDLSVPTDEGIEARPVDRGDFLNLQPPEPSPTTTTTGGG